ncbi:hypothetical protein Fmac_015299 [Flemingia macrophylla]|uniref:Uncharacterized protein n=1 Tax=Flemingia macrophylla TaxID=520843 RepID=A0ABD1ME74_9FABA
MNLVTQLATNQNPASGARVCGIRSSIDHHTSICPSSQQSGVVEHPEASAANTYRRPPQQHRQGTCARNDAIVTRGVHDVPTDASAEARKLEGKLDALVNLVTQLAANQKPASVARVCGIRSSIDNHTSQFSARNNAIVIRGIHDVSTDTSAEARKLEGKLYALVNLVTHLAAYQKPAFVARFSARNDAIVIRGVHDVATDAFAKARKLEGKLDALVNLLTQLVPNQKPASVPKFCGIRSSNFHDTNVYPSSQQSGVVEHPEAYAANTYSRPPQQQRQGT